VLWRLGSKIVKSTSKSEMRRRCRLEGLNSAGDRVMILDSSRVGKCEG